MQKHLSFAAVVMLAVAALAVTPLRGAEPAKPDAKGPATRPASQHIGGTADKAGGTVAGVVRFKGARPATRPITEIAGNAFCKECYKGTELPVRDDVVIGRNGNDETLQNVLVYVIKGLEGRTFEPPAAHAVLDQIGCIYTPHVVAVMVGQTLDVKNSDPSLHNVMAQPRNNPSFNFGMPVKDGVVERVFKKAELKINTRCFMHPWMSAYVHVLEHPYFAVTGADGSFEIRGLPPGEYELTVLHESSKLEATPATATVKVAAGATAQAEFAYQLRAPDAPK